MKTWLMSNVGTVVLGGAAVIAAGTYLVLGNLPEIPAEQPVAVLAPQPKTNVPAVVAVKPEPKSPKAPDIAEIDTPAFDLVRIEADGAAIIAGSAAPGTNLRIRFGAQALQTVTVDDSGSFVALVDLTSSKVARPLILEQIVAGGQVIPSAETVLVLPILAQENVAPKIILASASGVTVLQEGTIGAPAAETVSAPVKLTAEEAKAPALAAIYSSDFGLSLDTISYDKTGDVVLAGRGNSEQFVRVYVNNKPIETETVPSDGQWKVVLPSVKEGVYTLRVDAIDQSGTVTARVESPFKRETPENVAAAGAQTSAITVQPGHTLWALAQERYGDGVKYVQILNANRNRIRDPNLIYPGQVFELPE